MSKTLYIIGNGFDQYHGLPTSYKCFLCYMLKQHPNDTERIGFIFDRKNPNKLWSDFENGLETFDSLELVKKNIDNWIHIERLCEFENLFDNVHSELKSFFHEWVLQIQMELDNGKRITLDKDALFLNFNYTNTLERFYKITPSHICYIHRDTKNNKCAEPIVGHSHQNNCVEKSKCKICQYIKAYGKYPKWANGLEDFAQKVIYELNEFWDGLAKEPKIIQINPHEIYTIFGNKDFFNKCNNLDEIYVMGHSMNDVDRDYFRKIHMQSPNAQWHISKYNKTDEELKNQLAGLIGIEEKKINVDTFEMDSLLIKTNEESHIMRQVFIAQPMEESIIGKEIYEVVRIGNNGEFQPTGHRCMPKEAAEELARELNDEYNNLN